MQIKILVVDDHEDMLNLIQRKLQNRNISLLKTQKGSDVLDIVLQQKPHLILLDIDMPDINGIEVLSKIKSIPQMEKIPVIMVSAHGTSANITEAKRLGAYDFIAKPFGDDEFYKVVVGAINQHFI